ncbi:hypothetical protein MMC14_005715 [Varicellaria rhodocarpa]|nr:hypothetical protein [Varicellaria rhodocarpa]
MLSSQPPTKTNLACIPVSPPRPRKRHIKPTARTDIFPFMQLLGEISHFLWPATLKPLLAQKPRLLHLQRLKFLVTDRSESHLPVWHTPWKADIKPAIRLVLEHPGSDKPIEVEGDFRSNELPEVRDFLEKVQSLGENWGQVTPVHTPLPWRESKNKRKRLESTISFCGDRGLGEV